MRGQGDARNPPSMLREIVRTVDPNLPVTRSIAMTALIHHSEANDRLLATVFAAFAVMALMLGGIGVFAIAAAALQAANARSGSGWRSAPVR